MSNRIVKAIDFSFAFDKSQKKQEVSRDQNVQKSHPHEFELVENIFAETEDLFESEIFS